MHPHLLFPDYEYSVYIDGSVWPVSDFTLMAPRPGSFPVAMHSHKGRDCVYDELDACVAQGRDSPERLERHRERLMSKGVPRRAGLLEAPVIARRHHDPECVRIMEAWWERFMDGCRRDQVSLIECLLDLGIEPPLLAGLGTNVTQDARFVCSGTRDEAERKGIFRMDGKEETAAVPEVSVIMPVYNAADYIEAAVASVLCQTFADFELIAVDDGSTDGSGDKVAAAAARDSRIRVARKENGGASAARNFGLRLARGEFVAFIDHDDCYLPDFLEKLVSAMRSTGADMARCGRITIREDGGVLQVDAAFHGRNEFLDNAAFAGRYYEFRGNRTFLNAAWSGMYRWESVLSFGVSFPEGLRHGGEDIAFNRRMFAAGADVAVVTDILYVHYIRAGQSVSASSRPSFREALELSRTEREFVAAKAPAEAGMLDYIAMDECALTAVNSERGSRMRHIREAASEIRPRKWPFAYARRVGICRTLLWTMLRLHMLRCYAGCVEAYTMLGKMRAGLGRGKRAGG